MVGFAPFFPAVDGDGGSNLHVDFLAPAGRLYPNLRTHL